MNCPDCGRKGKVANSRPRPGNITYRRYNCRCGRKWSTHEKLVEMVQGLGVKPDNYDGDHIPCVS